VTPTSTERSGCACCARGRRWRCRRSGRRCGLRAGSASSILEPRAH